MRQLSDGTRKLAPHALLACLAGAMAACTTSSPTPDQMSRSSAATAPADLQLLCAEAAAKAAGVPSSRVLPVNSRQIDARTYEVGLNAGGSPRTCVIDDAGNVVSVQAAAT